jgi:hypothetical protein
MGETVGIAISSSYMLASIKLLLLSMIDKTERERVLEKVNFFVDSALFSDGAQNGLEAATRQCWSASRL